MPNVVAIVQARMGSSRLPGKVLKPIGKDSVLALCRSRVAKASSLSEVLVATSDTEPDNIIASVCETQGWAYSRGSEHDVLDRYYRAAVSYSADFIVRITADCPFVDPSIIDRVVDECLSHKLTDYVCTAQFPRGLDTEVIRFDALETAWREDNNSQWRQHVTPYFYHHPERFRLRYVSHSEDLSDMRWTLDTEADYQFLQHVFKQLPDNGFAWRDVLAVIENYRNLSGINKHIQQKDAGIRAAESRAIEQWKRRAS